MGNLFIEADKDEIINRIDELHPGSKPMWGKMSVAQMLAHCIVPVKISLGDARSSHSFIGKLLGKRFKNKMMKNDYVFQKNLPTDKSFIIKNEPDFYTNQQGLKDAIKKIFVADKTDITSRPHPFFGKMTTEEWGILGYKHLDHHLRQFGV